jgi:hypothetical protein
MFLWRGLHRSQLALLLTGWSREPAPKAQPRPDAERPQAASRPDDIAAVGPKR